MYMCIEGARVMAWLENDDGGSALIWHKEGVDDSWLLSGGDKKNPIMHLSHERLEVILFFAVEVQLISSDEMFALYHELLRKTTKM